MNVFAVKVTDTIVDAAAIDSNENMMIMTVMMCCKLCNDKMVMVRVISIMVELKVLLLMLMLNIMLMMMIMMIFLD